MSRGSLVHTVLELFWDKTVRRSIRRRFFL
jgi:hypothetical protein